MAVFLVATSLAASRAAKNRQRNCKGARIWNIIVPNRARSPTSSTNCVPVSTSQPRARQHQSAPARRWPARCSPHPSRRNGRFTRKNRTDKQSNPLRDKAATAGRANTRRTTPFACGSERATRPLWAQGVPPNVVGFYGTNPQWSRSWVCVTANSYYCGKSHSFFARLAGLFAVHQYVLIPWTVPVPPPIRPAHR